jgi:transposase
MATKRDLKALERRRLRGASLLKRGYTQAEVSRMCEVSRQTVSEWARALADGGKAALRRRRLGRPPALGPRERDELVRRLKEGALAQGFATELWTLARVGEVVARHFKVRYSHTQVWRLLGSLGFSVQRPAKKAIERDEAAIAAWKKKRWPVLKKTPQNKAA